MYKIEKDVPMPVRTAKCKYPFERMEVGVIEGSTTYFRIKPELFWRGTTEKRAEILKERGISVEVSFVIGTDAQKKVLNDIEKFENAGE